MIYELDDAHRAGFAYGTLEDHGECGEELFSVEIDPASEDVSYVLVAVSRPANWLSWCGFPYVRRLQAQFRRDSATAMKQALGC